MNKFADICSGRYFTIPENQRGFSWGADQVKDVIADLQLANTQSHYMGPLIVSRTEKADFQDDDLTTTVEFILEDGQQRLTTLFIFANEIQKEMVFRAVHPVHAQQLESYVFLKHQGKKLRLQNRQSALQDYLSFILIGTPAPPAERVPAMQALDVVQKEIRSFVSNLSDQELLAWKQRISNSALFVWVDLAEAGVNRYLTFDAINSRGLPLSEFDKIKNFCILVFSVRKITVSDVASNWYKALVQLEKYGADSRANEADFIAEIYSAYHNKPVSHRDVHAAFVSKYRALLSNADAALEADICHFIGLWETYARSFGFLCCRKRSSYYGSVCNLEGGKWLDRLDNMDLPTITRPVLAAAHLKFSNTEFADVVRACEIYTFRVHAVIRKRKDANATKIVELANEVLRGGKDIAHVLRKICGWLATYAPLARVIADLADGKPKYAYDQTVSGWAYCYYFLYEYELSVSPAGVAPLPYETNKESVKNQQEHILPQQHRDGGWWEAHWPDRAKAEEFKHRFGNLVLTVNNLALGRKPIGEKLVSPAPTHCYTHSNATNSEKRMSNFTDGSAWKEMNILKREIELLKFAAERWNLKCSNDNGTIDLPTEFSSTGTNSIVVNCEECVDPPEEVNMTEGLESNPEDSSDELTI